VKILSANCFGDYYTRTGLDLKMRALPTFSIIASLGGCEPNSPDTSRQTRAACSCP
jgi:alkylhydroperoxidase/carboxymuconolactone decarboxylase family protein YurZ